MSVYRLDFEILVGKQYLKSIDITIEQIFFSKVRISVVPLDPFEGSSPNHVLWAWSVILLRKIIVVQKVLFPQGNLLKRKK